MREAGVTVATVGVFSWALLEPQPGQLRARLARGVAGPPARARHRRRPGHGHCVTAAVADRGAPRGPAPHGRRHRALAGRPAGLVPELAGVPRASAGPGHCAGGAVPRPPGTGDVACLQRARRPQRALLLRRLGRGVPQLAAGRYRDARLLSTRRGAPPSGASGTADWDEVLPPRTAPTFANPTQQLDFARFSSDALLELLPAERDLLHRLTPGIPVTTNFMVCRRSRDMDYLRWGRRARPRVAGPLRHGGRPRRARRAGVERRPDARHRRRPPVVPDGALDQRGQLAAAQRRRSRPARCAATASRTSPEAPTPSASSSGAPSRAGAEKFHSALLPHAGTDTRSGARSSSSARRWRRSARSPAPRCAPRSPSSSTGTRAGPPSWTATPAADLDYLDRHHALYRALWDAGVTVDMVGPEADLSGYRLVLVPTLYLTTDAGAANIRVVRRVGRARPGHLLERHRRRERPRPARRLPRRVPRPAGRADRGVLPAARG